MIKILYMLFGITMKGTVDQIHGNTVLVELVSAGGHTHEEILPRWMFPCYIEEGTVFWIDTSEKLTTIRCQAKEDK